MSPLARPSGNTLQTVERPGEAQGEVGAAGDVRHVEPHRHEVVELAVLDEHLGL
jgi:hypothetical protein